MVKSRAVHAPYELKWPMPEIMQRPRMHLRPVLRKLLFCRHNSIRQQLQDVLARHADVRLLPSACANYGWRFDALRSKVVPQALEDGSSQQPSSVMALYSISASTLGSTHVAFDFLIGTESGEVFRISGSRCSLTSRATASV